MYNMFGSLELIIGPMFSGKSTELIKQLRKYQTIGKNILVINHSLNKRYNNNNLTTHNNESVNDCLVLTNMTDIFLTPDWNDYEVFIIEELQFFTDAYEVILQLVDEHQKKVICAGLNGDFLKQPFGDVLRLIPHADTVTKINALCKKCGDGTPALFSKRKTMQYQQTVIGTSEEYEAVCRYHYREESPTDHEKN